MAVPLSMQADSDLMDTETPSGAWEIADGGGHQAVEQFGKNSRHSRADAALDWDSQEMAVLLGCITHICRREIG